MHWQMRILLMYGTISCHPTRDDWKQFWPSKDMLLNTRAIFHVCNEYFFVSNLWYCYHSCLLLQLDHLMLFFVEKCYKLLFQILSYRFLVLKIDVISKIHFFLSVTNTYLTHWRKSHSCLLYIYNGTRRYVSILHFEGIKKACVLFDTLIMNLVRQLKHQFINKPAVV